MKQIARSVSAFILMAALYMGLTVPALAEGNAPVADNLELKTVRNTPLAGQLSAVDPDDDVVSYEITTQPVKGTITLDADGGFVYTPDANRKGRDYFGYKAIDAQGNVSQEATAIIHIEKP
ncbi:MAG: cadherin-like domain-containing protein [Oscillospiraceae bacterium]|nr:cadherin-like domain-containing protein [Oscillospiraceae bacterium]